MKSNYCEKHNQRWMDHVRGCPVCVGEKMVTLGQDGDMVMVMPTPTPETRPEETKEAPPARQVQLSLFD